MFKLKIKKAFLYIYLATILSGLFLALAPRTASAQFGIFGDGPPEGSRCASENTARTEVMEVDCEGFYTGDSSNPQPYQFQPNKCYTIQRPDSGPNDFNINEIPCDTFETQLRTEPDYNFEGDCKANGATLNEENCGIIADIVLFTRVISGLVGVVVVVMVAVGGIQYAASRDDPSQVAGAKKHIQNAVLGLVLYIFGLAFLQWLVPGGIF